MTGRRHPRKQGATTRSPALAWPLALFAALWLQGCGRSDPAPEPSEEPTARGFACGAPARPIHRLQRDASLVRQRLDPEIVDIEAVVVGNFQGGLGGFYVQSARGEDDGDAATPEGVFVEHRSEQPRIRVGQRLRLRGAWATSEDPARGELGLRRIERVLDCGSGEMPEPVVLTSPATDWASLAGMRVHLPGPIHLTGNYTLLRDGELWLSFDGRLRAPTEQVPPGAQARALDERNQQRLIIVDDARRSQYPRELWHLPEPVSAQAPYRVGSVVHGIDAVVDYRFDSWRLQPTSPIERVEQAPRPGAPARDRALLRVAGFNLLNFFNGDGQGGGFPTERGAGSRVDQFRQRDKLVAAMTALDADVFGVMEVENDGYGSDSAMAELAQALSDQHAAHHGGDPDKAPVYSIVDPGVPRLGDDVIAVGLLYRNDRVRPVGEPRHLTGAPFGTLSRVPLAQAFTSLDGDDEGERAFLVVVNHFKSKGCRDASGDQVDSGDGQACYAQARLSSTRILLEWLERENPPYRTARSLVIGDLNAHSQEPPVRTLTQRGLVDLPAQFGDGAHTYVFRGQAGRLDHAFGGSAVASRVRAAGTWAINADELPEFDYDGDARSGQRLYAPDAFGSSDHDPVWVDLEP